jgi:alcohol dehydrogenase class IV
MNQFHQARSLLREFKGDVYLHGLNVLNQVGEKTAQLGYRAAIIRDSFPGAEAWLDTIRESLEANGVTCLGEMAGPKPNAPRKDLNRIAKWLKDLDPDVIVSFGGGSTIDVTKTAEVLRTLVGDIENYFGTGLVTQALKASGKVLTPHVAIQTAASSGAHLTKYSNITDLNTSQKKLIVDEAIVPVQPVFDYDVTVGAPSNLTVDGALDGIAHSLEVLYGVAGKSNYESVKAVAEESIRLVVEYLPQALAEPQDSLAREALGLATDLGGYAIMLGGTNGAHLTSFSLVDVLSHGRACAIMNPYYTVFFAPAIQEPLKVVGKILATAGYSSARVEHLEGRELGIAVAEAMITFEKAVGMPVTLGEVPGFSDLHIQRALTAAKNPQLKMKLENMPVALNANMVDEYMGPVLQAAKNGDLSLIRNVPH